MLLLSILNVHTGEHTLFYSGKVLNAVLYLLTYSTDILLY